MNQNFQELADAILAPDPVSLDCDSFDEASLTAEIEALAAQSAVKITVTGQCSAEDLLLSNGMGAEIEVGEGSSLSLGSLRVYDGSSLKISGEGNLSLRDLFTIRNSVALLSASGTTTFSGSGATFPIYGFIKSAIQLSISGCDSLQRGLAAYAGGGSRVEVNYYGDMTGCFDGAAPHYADTLSYVRIGDRSAQGTVTAPLLARENGVISLINYSEIPSTFNNQVTLQSGAYGELRNFCGSVRASAASARVEVSPDCPQASLYLYRSSIEASGPIGEIIHDGRSGVRQAPGRELDTSNAAISHDCVALECNDVL